MSFEKHITKRKKVPFLSFVLLGILIMGCVFAPFFCKDASYMDLMTAAAHQGVNFSLEQILWDAICFHVSGMADVFLLPLAFYQLQYQQLLQFCMAQQVHCHLRGWIGF